MKEIDFTHYLSAVISNKEVSGNNWKEDEPEYSLKNDGFTLLIATVDTTII